MQHASLILNNNDTKSRNFTSFTNGCLKKYLGFPPDVTFLSYFYEKDICASHFKGDCSVIFGKWVFFRLTDMVTFQTNYHSRWKKYTFVSLLKVITENNVNVIYCFIKWWETCCLISERVFTHYSRRQRVCTWNFTHKAF